ncbi:MAG: Lipoprotein-releasing system transmembrane protein LolE [Planctomycetes bacterium ADurb.Bin401]|nr:MAG: Lipoprotein-releasing system transmembrane protein LolE [Planctomycetes bacterium ADurb.Bin401]
MLKFFLAIRYLKKRKIVLLSIAAVMLSTALLVTVASLFTAFINAIEISASDYLGDIVLEPYIRITRYDKLITRLAASEKIDSATPVLSSNGLIYLDAGNVKAVNFWGIDLESRCKVTNFGNNLLAQEDLNVPEFKSGQENAIPVFTGIAMLIEPDIKTDEYDFAQAKNYVGKKAVITTGTVETDMNSPSGMLLSRSAQVSISDVVFTSVYDIDKRFVFMPIDQLTSVLYGPGKMMKAADVIHIKCAAGREPSETIETVRKIWTDFAVQDLNWPESFAADVEILTAMQKQAGYTSELRKQMGVLLVVFGIISAGIIVLVFCIFYMIVKSKQKDLAIIKSIGASSGDITSIFLLFGLFVGIIGAAGGLLVGYVVSYNINAMEQFVSNLFGLKLWSSSIYMFTKIPTHFDWFWAVFFFFAAVAASVLGAVLPSIIAAKTSPVKILRYE